MKIFERDRKEEYDPYLIQRQREIIFFLSMFIKGILARVRDLPNGREINLPPPAHTDADKEGDLPMVRRGAA